MTRAHASLLAAAAALPFGPRSYRLLEPIDRRVLNDIESQTPERYAVVKRALRGRSPIAGAAARWADANLPPVDPPYAMTSRDPEAR